MPSVDLDEPLRKHSHPCIMLKNIWTVSASLAHLRRSVLPQRIIYLYVVDADNRLTGVVPTRRLLMSKPSANIQSIAVPDVVSLPADATVMDACDFFVMYRYLAIPVVEEDGTMLGAIDVDLFADELVSASERTSTNDIFQIIGLTASRNRKDSALKKFMHRMPWLMSNIVGGIICAFLASAFSVIEAVVAVALFVPVILTLSESVSMQATTITLQQLHGKHVTLRDILESITSEFPVTLLLSAACGIIVATVAFFWLHLPLFTFVIGLSIIAAIVFSSLLGMVIPVIVRMFGRDPKVAAGPLVLAAGDIATLVGYFGLAQILLHK